MIDVVHSTLLTLLIELSDVESKQAFVELCRFLAAFCQRLKRGEEMIQDIVRAAEESETELPPDAVDILSIGSGSSFWGQASPTKSMLANS